MRGRASIAAVAVLAAAPAFPHGASKGLHLHVEPETAAPGAEIVVRVDAVEPVVSLRVSVVGAEPESVGPEEPVKTIVVSMKVPAGAKAETINLQAEAVGRSGKVFRSSAIVKLKVTERPDLPGGSGSGGGTEDR